MRKLFITLASGILMAACSLVSQQKKVEGQIDALPAFDNLTELKVSQLGKSIRYVPLETNDSVLIGGVYQVHLLKNTILVTYMIKGKGQSFLFDRGSGKFLREIGHQGEDPRGYSIVKAYVHPETEEFYFPRLPNKLIKYNLKGEFLGEVVMPLPEGFPSGFYPLLTKEGMLVYEGPSFNPDHQKQLYYLDETKGKTGDVILPASRPNVTDKESDVQSMSVWIGGLTGSVGLGTLGLLTYSGVTSIDFKNKVREVYALNYPAVWKIEDSLHLHETFSDTIHHIKDFKLASYRVFNLGDRHLSMEERGKKEGNEDKLAITYVLETEDLIYFQCAKNLFGDNLKIYNGLYRKSDETVLMNEREKAFTDDLTGFLPFTPASHTTKGEFVGTLSIERIQEWIDEHPEIKLEGALASLKDLDDDANPIVVIVEP